MADGSGGSKPAQTGSDGDDFRTHVQFSQHRDRSFPQVLFAMAFAMAISYRGMILPQSPVSDGTSPKCARNAEIRARHQKGESIAKLAEVFGITKQRIWQILNDRRK
jgi:hypothetical protein